MSERMKGILIIAVIYIFAALSGTAVYRFFIYLNKNVITALAAADLAATVIVWAAGVIYKNSSIYDPYWSVAPIVILSAIALEYSRSNIVCALTLTAVWLWGVRLTLNWAYTFKGIKYQDWRYDKYRSDYPRLWALVNFFGINLMPTIIVFMVILPAIEMIRNVYSVNIFTVAAFIICVLAVMIQLSADSKLHRFRNSSKGDEVCREGLWQYSRHPNYFGEVLMWWGIYIMMLSVVPSKWFMAAGAVLNTLLFVFVSIPLMEKRQMTNKPDYTRYQKETSMLIPLLRR